MGGLCNLCPRNCNAPRTEGKYGFCNVGNEVTISRASLHMWEEPCISGLNGSGTIFFDGCNLRCVYCQNSQISRGSSGICVSTEKLGEIMLELQSEGANNINLVTPSHYINEIICTLKPLRESNKLIIPVVYNSSAYEKVNTLKRIEGLVDIYLPDLKYFSSELSRKYSNAADYFEYAVRAIEEMLRQVGAPKFNAEGIMVRGVIVRHLCIPGCVKDSKAVIGEIYRRFGNDVYISIMSQYTPTRGLEKYPEINRKLRKREYEKVVDYAIALGVENGFVQEGDAASESFIPEFSSS